MYKTGAQDGSKYVAEILSSITNGKSQPSSILEFIRSFSVRIIELTLLFFTIMLDCYQQLPDCMYARYFYPQKSIADGSTYSTIASPSASAILTPRTLANIEQTFMELQSETRNTSDTQVTFVPPFQTGSSAEQSPSSSLDQPYSEGEWTPPSEKRPRISVFDNPSIYSLTSQRKPRKFKDEQANLSPEEEHRRLIRRERNKIAAAKCRQRRVDHTNRLITETEQLRDEQNSLEAEILKLTEQRDQYEFVLQSHKQVCSQNLLNSHNISIKHEPVNIKSQYVDLYTTNSSSLLNYNNCELYTSPSNTSLTSHSSDASNSRPTSLSLSCLSSNNHSNVTSAIGIAITTPSAGYFNFSTIDGFPDGSTGLTPMNSNPCGREMVKRGSTDNSPENGLASPSLITLR